MIIIKWILNISGIGFPRPLEVIIMGTIIVIGSIGSIMMDNVAKHINGVQILLKKDEYAELLAYFARILFNDAIKDYSINVQHMDKELEISIVGNSETVDRKVMRYKDNAYVHYNILLSSLKFLCNEMGYVTIHKLYRFSLEELYKNSMWEKFLYEKIIC